MPTMQGVEIVYSAIALAAVPVLLVLFHRLSRPPRTVADEAERWLLEGRPGPGTADGG